MQNFSCKYEHWLSEYNFDNCKLERGVYAKFLKDYLVGEKDGFVLNLNGSWGSGKTEFLKRFYSLLIHDGYPTVYIDAWESDFSREPLTVVSSEFINQLSQMNENIGDELEMISEFLGKAIKGTFIAGSGLFTKHVLGEASIGTEFAKSLYDESPKELMKRVVSDHNEYVSSIKEIRRNLELLAEVLNSSQRKKLPVIVLIDELDRCRPNYAIEMLEVVKHFFTTKNFVFVIATDTNQLEKSIKTVYGNDFDSTKYLKRFFNREAQLDLPDLNKYLNLISFDVSGVDGKVFIYPIITTELEGSIRLYVYWLASAYGLTIRDVDQLANKLNAFIRVAVQESNATSTIQFINIFSAVVSLIEYDFDRLTFDSRSDSNPLYRPDFKNDILVDVDNNVYLKEIYEIVIYYSVRHNVTSIDDNLQDYFQSVYGTDLRISPNFINGRKGLARIFSNKITEGFRKYETLAKVWLWKDYQRLAKLAGKIN